MTDALLAMEKYVDELDGIHENLSAILKKMLLEFCLDKEFYMSNTCMTKKCHTENVKRMSK